MAGRGRTLRWGLNFRNWVFNGYIFLVYTKRYVYIPSHLILATALADDIHVPILKLRKQRCGEIN